jgi:hypothetical protein
VNGANFTSDAANLATFEYHKYDRNNKIRAINSAARKIFPVLYKPLNDITLSTNNILPNPSFEDWTSSANPDYWGALSNATATETTTAGLYRGLAGSSSIRIDTSAANGYCALPFTYPQLLDLSGQTVNFYCWAYPEVADDAFIEIYTLQADGTSQTLTSDTSCPAGAWTLLTLQNQSLNDDLVQIYVRLKVKTSGKYAYFDNARLTGIRMKEYLLPLDFQSPLTLIDNVYIQSTGIHEYYVDDMLSYAQFVPEFYWDVYDRGATKYLSLPYHGDNRLIKIMGRAPLESVSSATDTMTIEDPQLDLLVELAASELFRIEAGLPSQGERDFMFSESLRYLANYEYMKKNLKMKVPQKYVRFRDA